MGQGQGSITVNQRNIPAPPPGPPFSLTSADNGLSVDPITGRIVLGQDVGAVGNPAQLTTAREIPLNGQSIQMKSPAFLFPMVWIDDGAIPFILLGDVLGMFLEVGPLIDVTQFGNPNVGNRLTNILNNAGGFNRISSAIGDHFLIDVTGLYRFGDITGNSVLVDLDQPNVFAIFQASPFAQFTASAGPFGNFVTMSTNFLTASSVTCQDNVVRIAVDVNAILDVNGAARQLIFSGTNGILLSDSTAMIHTTGPMANGAGIAAGTLLNAPAAGNPTKWIPFDDAGTIRYIPAW